MALDRSRLGVSVCKLLLRELDGVLFIYVPTFCMAKFARIFTTDNAFIIDVRNKYGHLYRSNCENVKKDFASNGALNCVPAMSTFQMQIIEINHLIIILLDYENTHISEISIPKYSKINSNYFYNWQNILNGILINI